MLNPIWWEEFWAKRRDQEMLWCNLCEGPSSKDRAAHHRFLDGIKADLKAIKRNVAPLHSELGQIKDECAQSSEQGVRLFANLTRNAFENVTSNINKLHQPMLVGLLSIVVLGFLFLSALAFILMRQQEARKLEFEAKIATLQEEKKVVNNELVSVRKKLDEVTKKYHESLIVSKNEIIQQLRMPSFFPPLAFAGEPVVSGRPPTSC